jgi:hypothetical protein
MVAPGACALDQAVTTLSYCMRFWIGPITMPGAMPSPIGMASASSLSSARSASNRLSCTYSRLAQAQVWPMLMKAPQNRPIAIAFGSASGSMMAASLPPNSIVWAPGSSPPPRRSWRRWRARAGEHHLVDAGVVQVSQRRLRPGR